MRFRTELSYDAAPDAVFAMLSDRAYREKVLEARAEVVSYEVSLELSGAGFTLVTHQVQDTAGLPSIAKKFAGDTTQAVVTETWKDGSGATVEIVAPGKPTKTTGTLSLKAAGSGTVEVVDLDVKVKVPLIGGKLEALVVAEIESGYAAEQRVGTAWLAGER